MNISTGEIRYVNAGHNPPLMIRTGAQPEFIPSTGDLVMGAMPDIAYHSEQVTLGPEDTLLLYTDGVTEAMNPGRELFSESRLSQAAQDINALSASDGVAAIHDAVTRFSAGATQSDDITLLLLRYRGVK